MGWIDFAWPMIGGASLALGLVFLLAWSRQPRRYGYAMFFVTALSVAAFSIFELRMMRATTPGEYAATLRWAHLPLFTLVVSVVGFVRLHFHAGRAWLGYLGCGLRAVSLVLNFHSEVNLNFDQVTAMLPVPVWGGEHIYLPAGIPNRFAIVAQLGNLLVLCFLADAASELWRRGGAGARRHAAMVGILFLSLLATAVFAALLNLSLVRLPTLLSVAFLAVVVAVAYELGWEVIAAAQLAERLRTSEERLQLAASAGALGLWEWNATTDEVWMTGQGRELFGYRADEPVHLARFLEAVHPDDRAAVERSVSSSVDGQGRDFLQDFRIVLPDGRVRWVTSRGRIERDGTGVARGMLGASQDVTARKDAEREAARQRDEIAHLARVAMLGELSGSLAHELNQPLSAILSNAQAAQRFLARDPPELDKVQEILRDIVKSDKRAGQVITRLRSLFKKEQAQYSAVDVNDAVQDVLALVRSDLLSRQVSVSTELAAELPAVSGDRVQLQQVLLNLLVNGCDAMADAQPPRSLNVRTELASGGQVILNVIDHGTGIPVEDLERIFEPFVSTKPQGMGLGLAVCRSIVNAHGGRLWATNNREGGSRFIMELPAIGP